MSFSEDMPPERDFLLNTPAEITEFIDSPQPTVFEPSPRVWRWSILLFCLTCCSTFFIGMTVYSGVSFEILLTILMNGHPRQHEIWMRALWSGASYSLPVMSILLAHELGHFLQARRYGVPAIPPLFIPVPLPPFGTMGAVIVQSPHHADRKQMFDIGISGPLAGLCLALPIVWLGIQQSSVAEFNPHVAHEVFGDPLILKWMIQAKHGPLAENQDVVINPLLMAGWVGVFLTALNLMPIGQLDGGHILYCLIGKSAHWVARLVIVGVIVYMFLANYWAFSVMVLLLIFMGVNHPPTTDDHVPLGWFRVILGWLTLAFLVVGIHPKPLDIKEPVPVPVEEVAPLEPT